MIILLTSSVYVLTSAGGQKWEKVFLHLQSARMLLIHSTRVNSAYTVRVTVLDLKDKRREIGVPSVHTEQAV